MKDNMKDKIITGTVTNNATGETNDIIPFYWFSNGCELIAIAKILNVESFFHPENNPPDWQISADCLALDYQGNVFNLNLHFLPNCLDDKQKIISEITEGKILVVSGRFTVIQKECIITLYDPEYYPLPPEYSLEEVEEVFRFNNKDNKNRLN